MGDRWSQFCVLGLEGETLAEGQLRTTQEDVREFFQALTVARVVIEVGTHSAWVQDVITEWGHEVLVANPRLMEGSKRRKRKSDRIDANRVGPLGAGGSAVVVPDSASQSGSAPGSGGVASPGRLGVGADGVNQHRARTGEKYRAHDCRGVRVRASQKR